MFKMGRIIHEGRIFALVAGVIFRLSSGMFNKTKCPSWKELARHCVRLLMRAGLNALKAADGCYFGLVESYWDST